MGQGIKLWIIWLAALFAGVYGTALVYQGIFAGQPNNLWYGIPTLLMGIWVTGNIWASARQAYRRQRAGS
ncbi:hypothetical protein [Alicyclobacillus sp. SO9]|uniref:hypothetical protein n=1 Tax=Alicyclobacillus sp. SO9 TaxID=2665646 RepID=UPI0018E6E78F|nr:hypothetical protein [Alicyclobacillus sp. SO9]QQE76847.1 hypothetical protein GI364_12570 [Alicyclobacillus sp. SO9]